MCTIAALKIAQKEAGIGDDEYRAMLVQLTRKTSSTQCTPGQRDTVLRAILRRRNGVPGRDRAPTERPTAKLWALWYALKPHLPAECQNTAYLVGICRKANFDVTTITDPVHQSPVQLHRSIEALKARIQNL